MSTSLSLFQNTAKYSGHIGAVYELCRLDDHHFLSCSGDGYIVKWKINDFDLDGKVLAHVNARVFSICLVKDHLLVVGDMNGEMYWIDLHSHETIRRFQTHRKGIFSLIFYQGFLYSAGGDGVLTRWNVESMYPEESLQVTSSSLRKIKVLGKNQFLIAASDGNIHLVNIAVMTTSVFISNAHDPSVFCLAISADSIYSGGRDAHIRKFSLSGELIQEIPAHWFTVNELIYVDSQEPLLISASRDKKIRVWNADNLELIQSIDVQLGGHINSVNDVLYIPKEKVLLTASDDRTISRFQIVP